MVSTSFFSGLIALTLAVLLGFLAAWIWRGKRMAFLESQAARLRRDRRTLAQRLSQSDSRLDSANFNRNETDQSLAELKARHEALEAEYAALAASYANLKQGIVGLADEDDDWFDGLDGEGGQSSGPDVRDENAKGTADDNSTERKNALRELEAFEKQLSQASAELAREVSDQRASDDTLTPDSNPLDDTGNPVDSGFDSEVDPGLREQFLGQQAEIARLKEQMAPLLGLPLAVSAREAERDRLASKLESRERELSDLNLAVSNLSERERKLKQELERLRASVNDVNSVAGTDGDGDTDIADIGNAGDATEPQKTEPDKAVSADSKPAKNSKRKNKNKKNKSDASSGRDHGVHASLEDNDSQSMRDAVIGRDEWPDLELGDDAIALQSGQSASGSSPPLNGSKPAKIESATGVRALAARSSSLSTSKADAASVAAPRQYRKAPGQVDNLKEIKGIGPVLERMLNRLGVYQFRQIASWQEEDIVYFDAHLADFRGRIRRDRWVEGASTAQTKKYG